MSVFDNAVSIHPYFKIQEGQMDACKSLLARFCQRTSHEEMCFYCNFAFHDDVLFCR